MEILEDGGRIMRSVPVSGPHSMHNTFNKKSRQSSPKWSTGVFRNRKFFFTVNNTRMGTYILT